MVGSPDETGEMSQSDKGGHPPRRRRWQAMPNGDGVSAAEAKWILRLKVLTILTFPFGESVAESDERGLSR